MILVIALLYDFRSSLHNAGLVKLSHFLLWKMDICVLILQPWYLCTSKISFSNLKGAVFESELSLLPKVILGVRSVVKYTNGISPGFSAAFGSRFRKLTESNSRIYEKNPSHFKCSLYNLNSIGFCPSLLIDKRENNPIDAMKGGEKSLPTAI